MKPHKSLVSATIAVAFALSPAMASEQPHKMDHSSDHKMDHKKSHGGDCAMAMGEGVINAIDVQESKINITHKPIAAIGWPEMTMDFTTLKPVDLSAFAAEERVHFMLRKEKSDTYSVAMMCSLDIDDDAHNACMGKMHEDAMLRADADGKSCSMGGMDHSAMGQEDADAKQDHGGHH